MEEFTEEVMELVKKENPWCVQKYEEEVDAKPL
jgi:hypothetical protein